MIPTQWGYFNKYTICDKQGNKQELMQGDVNEKHKKHTKNYCHDVAVVMDVDVDMDHDEAVPVAVVDLLLLVNREEEVLQLMANVL